jgi:hypothetical protein
MMPDSGGTRRIPNAHRSRLLAGSSKADELPVALVAAFLLTDRRMQVAVHPF